MIDIATGDITDDPADYVVVPADTIMPGDLGARLVSRAFLDAFPGLASIHREAIDAGRLRPGYPIIVTGRHVLFPLSTNPRDDAVSRGLSWLAGHVAARYASEQTGFAIHGRRVELSVAIPALSLGLGGITSRTAGPEIREFDSILPPHTRVRLYYPG